MRPVLSRPAEAARPVSGVPGQPLPWWAPELQPCGTIAAARRHERRGEDLCRSCRQARARDWADRKAAGLIPTRRPREVVG